MKNEWKEYDFMNKDTWPAEGHLVMFEAAMFEDPKDIFVGFRADRYFYFIPWEMLDAEDNEPLIIQVNSYSFRDLTNRFKDEWVIRWKEIER